MTQDGKWHLIVSISGVAISMIVLIGFASRPENALFSWGSWGPTLLTLLVSELGLNFVVLWRRTRNPFAWIPALEKSSGLSEKLRGAQFNFCAISSKDPALWRSATFLFYLQDNAAKTLAEMSKHYGVPIVFSRDEEETESYIQECRRALQAVAALGDTERFVGIRLMIYDSRVLREEERLLREMVNLHARGGMYCVPVRRDVLVTRLYDDDKASLNELSQRIGEPSAQRRGGRATVSVPDFLLIDNHSQAPATEDRVWWFQDGEWRTGTARDYRTAREVFALLCKKALEGALAPEFNSTLIDSVAIPNRLELGKKFFSLPYFENWLLRAPSDFQDWFQAEEKLLRALPPDSRVLDVGCGAGRHMEVLAKMGASVEGVDDNADMIERATLRLKYNSDIADRVQLHMEDAKRMHFPSETYGVVICMTNTLGNMLGIERDVLNEMARVLRPGGKLILSVYRDDPQVVGMRGAAYEDIGLHIRKVTNGTINTHEGLISRHFSKKDLETECRSLGLTPHVEPFGRLAYLCEAIKGPGGGSASASS